MIHRRGIFILWLIIFAAGLFQTAAGLDPQEYLDRVQRNIEEKGASWTAALNPIITDMTEEERQKLCGFKKPDNWEEIIKGHSCDSMFRQKSLPSSVNWEDSGMVTPAKSQGSCGSCWAFAAVGHLESQFLIDHGIPLDLSEQQVLSCNTHGGDCDGGWPVYAYQDWINVYAAIPEEAMPYQANDGIPCTQGNYYPVAGISLWFGYLTMELDNLKSALNYGPFSASMMVFDDFYGYSSGCYSRTSDIYVGLHAIVVVGYDDNMCGGAFRAKNSWGEWWGDDGFFWITYDQMLPYLLGIGGCHFGDDGVIIFTTCGPDTDGDGTAEYCDNCPRLHNPGQDDADDDLIGDACDDCTDTDGDGYGDPGYPVNTCITDNCPSAHNPSQADFDGDGYGDVCDNCPMVYNPDQLMVDDWTSTYGGAYNDRSYFVQPLEDTAWYLDDTTISAYNWSEVKVDTLTLGQDVAYYLNMSGYGAAGGYAEIRKNGNLVVRLNHTGTAHDTSGSFFAMEGDIITADVDLNLDKSMGGDKEPQAEASFTHITYFVDFITPKAFAMIGSRESSPSNADFALVETDICGSVNWSRVHGTPGYDQAQGGILTSDYGYLAVGETNFGGGHSVYLVKFDSLGNAEWDHTYQYGTNDWGKSVIEVADGYIVAGITDVNGDNDFMLLKVNSSGTEQWHYIYGDAGIDDDAEEVIRTLDGGFLTIGSSGSVSVDWDIFLVKTDADGILNWTRRPGSPSYDECGNGVVETGDGYMLGGSTNETGDFNMLLMKVDGSGNEIWRQNYGGGNGEHTHDLLVESGGGCVLVGGTESFGSGMSDFFCVFTDPLGNLVDYTTFGGADDEIAYNIRKTADAGYVITGSTESYGAGNSDFYTVKFVGVPPPPPLLVSPVDGYEHYAPRSLSLKWNSVSGATSYRVQLDNNADFSSPIINVAGIADTFYITPSLNANTYYWRISTTNAYGDGGWSLVWSFTLHSKVPVLSYPTNGSGIENEDSLRLSWSCVWKWNNYEVIIDDNSDFSSPERNEIIYCDCWWNGSYYISPPLPTGTRYYWKVRASGLTSSWSQTWNFFLQQPPITSCPVLYTYNGIDFVEDNPLLTACEKSGYSEIVTDYYHVTREMADRDGKIIFQLKELDEEITYLYDMELITVDHSPSTKVGCSVDGRIFSYRDELPPLSAVDHTGTDQLATLLSEDGVIYRSEGFGQLTITFPNPGLESGFSFNAPPKLPCPHEDPGDGFGKIRPEEELPPSALTVEILTNDGDWIILPNVPARKHAVTEFVLSDLPAEITSEVLNLRISWENGFSTDVIRQHIPTDEIPSVDNWEIESHELSLGKPFAGDWIGFDNETPLVLAKGDFIEFGFAPVPLTDGMKRDYIIRSVGRYQPDYAAFSDMLPSRFQLYHNYPNPFNPATTMRYDLPHASQVRLEVYNVLGQRIATLVDESQEAGQHQVSWNGVDSDGRPVSSGIYFYRLKTDEFVETKKMMLLK